MFYKGSMEGITDVIAGRTHAMFAPASTVMPQTKSASSSHRSDRRGPDGAAPDVPTMAESGLPGYEVTMWNGLFAPAGTPPEIVEKLAAAATKAVASPDLQSKIKNNGGDPIVMGPKEFGDYLKKDISRWSEAIEAAGIKPQ